MYECYIRNWWKEETDRHGRKKLVPHPHARKTLLAWARTEEEALKICEDYNSTHNPGKLSRKAEFSRDY